MGLKGLREERAPEEDGRPEEEDEEAERFRESEGELGQREGVGCDEGEEAEGYQVGFHGFSLVRVLPADDAINQIGVMSVFESLCVISSESVI